MFSNLVESGSHKRDLKRKSSFFLGTLAFYVALLTVAGVGSVYAYNARLDEPDYEVIALMRFPPVPADAPRERRDERPAAVRPAAAPRFTTRPVISVITPYNNRQVAPPDVREVSARERVVIAPLSQNAEPAAATVGPVAVGNPRGSGGAGGVVVRDDGEDIPPTLPRVAPTPEPKVEKRAISLGVINGRAVDKPVPAYPQIAKAAGAQGTVTVQILVDESGRVLSAKATGGHPMLLKASVEAAYKARFTPTLLSGQPVKVNGYITYNFVLR